MLTLLPVDGLRPPGKDDALRPALTELFEVDVRAIDLRIDALIPHPPRDQLIVLSAEIQNGKQFFLHPSPPLYKLLQIFVIYGIFRSVKYRAGSGRPAESLQSGRQSRT